MEQIFALMAILGAFTFIGCGLCSANSIEAKESEITANILVLFVLLGMLSFVIGFFGLIVYGLFI